MDFELALMGIALHMLIWGKLPNWGTWFNTLIAALPPSLQMLYRQWNCSYCAGFWIGLTLHGMTGLWTLPTLATPPDYMGALGMPANWFLDALATGTLIYAGNMVLKALGLPVLQARLTREAEVRKATLRAA
jgi:hypothetical protein